MCVNIMTMSIDLEIAHKATIRPISTIAAKLGLNVEETIPLLALSVLLFSYGAQQKWEPHL